MQVTRILDDLCAAQHELDTASERIITLTERALARSDDDEITTILGEVLEACAFGDLVGQRLARIATATRERAGRRGALPHTDPRPDAGLLNGPDHNGLKQNDVDILMRTGSD